MMSELATLQGAAVAGQKQSVLQVSELVTLQGAAVAGQKQSVLEVSELARSRGRQWPDRNRVS